MSQRAQLPGTRIPSLEYRTGKNQARFVIHVVQKFKLDDKEYDISEISDSARAQLASLHFVEARLTELKNMEALLQRAKNSYVDGLKKEVISGKAGLLFGED